MRRAVPLLLPLLLAVACEGGAPPPRGPVARLRVGFPPRGLVDTIAVDAVDRLPLRAAELVAPDGTATPASYLDVAASPQLATGQRVAGDPWQNSLSNANSAAALAAQRAEAGATVQGQQQLLAMVSTAEIPLPDPVAYHRDWQHYRIRLTFGTPPDDVETQEIAAPEPPPEPPG